MNKLRNLFLVLFLFMAYGIFAQNVEESLLTIDNKSISLSDFEYAYLKDKQNNIQSPMSVEDFLKSFGLLKVKVAEAEELGLDKDPIFISEYNKYAEAAKEKYTNDTISEETVAKLIYDRLLYNIEVSKIFVPFASEKVFAKDTLAAYNKILKIRESVVNSPDSEYKKAARKHPAPESPTETETVWTTALSSPKALEDAIYNTPEGSISQPIRTNVGYYLVKVYGKRKDRGEVRVSHILFAYPDNATPHEIDSVKKLVQRVITDLDDNQSFEGICRAISADRKTAEKGGELGWFGARSNLMPKFDSIFYSLQKVRDYTRPIEFDYGFQIFKLIGKTALDPWPEIKPDLLNEIEKEKRKGDIDQLKLKKLSTKYPYTINDKEYRNILDIADQHHASDSLFFKELPMLYKNELVTIRDKKYTIQDFVNYIFKNLSASSNLSTDIVNEKMDGFLLSKLSELNEQRIIEDAPELRHLLQEYYDGILLFSAMEQEVWIKAPKDTVGLTETFEQNRDKYLWSHPKYKGHVIFLKDKQTLDKALALQKKHGSQTDFTQILIKSLSNDSVQSIFIEKGIWAKGENDFVDNTFHKTKIKKEIVGYPYFFIHGKMINQPETYQDVKGLVVQDYQEILEKKWINDITQKHKIVINNQALQHLIQKYQQ